MAWSPQARKAALLARKRKAIAKNKKRLGSKRYKRRGVQEYIDEKGKKTGLATTTSSKTFSGAMRKARRAGKHNKRYQKKIGKLNKKISKASKKTQPKRGIGRDGKTRLTKAQLKNRKLKTHAKYGYGPNGKKLSKAQMRKKKRR